MTPRKPAQLAPMDPADEALLEWEAQRPRWEELQNRPLPDAEALARWIADWSDFSDAVTEAVTRLRIASDCDTRDEAKAAAYLRYAETVEPELATATDRLNRKLIDHPDCGTLSADHRKWIESVRTGIELFHPDNLPLHAEITRLIKEYDQVRGAATVEWEGKSRSLTWMEALLQDPDRGVRERAWRLVAERRQADADRIDAIYDRMLAVRARIATTLGLRDFTEYSFRSKLRTDYTPGDCFTFHAAVEATAVPVHREALAARRQGLGLDRLRPWDLNCDPGGAPALKPFDSIDELVDKTARIFEDLDPELAAHFAHFRDHGVLELENRVGKAAGGYMEVLGKSRLPFIYMNAVGVNRDLFTLLHESGHSFHYFLGRHHALPFNRQTPPMEFAEVASMAMERLGAAHLREVYGPVERRRAIRGQAEETTRRFLSVAAIDAFQHWIYANPHDPAARRAKWIELDERYNPGVDWSGLESLRGAQWQRILHLFHSPFYYIEYGLAQIGALQVWMRSVEESPAAALQGYKHALALGATRGVRDLFSAAGLRFGMDEATLRPLVDAVRAEWRATQ